MAKGEQKAKNSRVSGYIQLRHRVMLGNSTFASCQVRNKMVTVKNTK